jgi:hypothetical protein
MVERLSTLLHEEATATPVPLADVDRIMRSGRRFRRRRRLTEGVAVAATVGAVVTVGMAVVTDSAGTPEVRETFQAASATAAFEDYGAFSIGSTVYVGNQEVSFDQKIKALYYTSEGVLVRMGAKAETDTGGKSLYVLVAPDGSTRAIDLHMGDRVPGTDPGSPYVAYAAPNGDRWDLVALDLRTGEEAARVTVQGKFTWGGWEAPPVTTAGTRMWALFDDGWREFDWSNGTTRLVPGTANAPLDAAHGRYALHDDGRQIDWLVKDFATGSLVATVPMDPANNVGSLSPDGRFVRLDGGASAVWDGETGKLIEPPAPSRFYSVASGKIVSLPARVFYGWTPDGHTLSVDSERDQVTVCDPATGDCDRIDLKIGSGKVKLGGLSYES